MLCYYERQIMVSNTDSATQRLLDFIKNRKPQSDNRLPTHAELCKRLKVGSRPLREALSVLSQQGIVETRRRGGTVLAEPGVEVLHDPLEWQLEQKGYTFEDMVRARAAVESAIAAEAANRVHYSSANTALCIRIREDLREVLVIRGCLVDRLVTTDPVNRRAFNARPLVYVNWVSVAVRNRRY